MATITAALIVKNEEGRLGLCLERLKSLVDDIVVVDTGSTDATVAEAKAFTDQIFTFDWIDDFSAARNHSIEQARGDYVLVCDADDQVGPVDEGRSLLDRFITNQDPQVAGTAEVWSTIHTNNEAREELSVLPRFFRRGMYHFEGAIHEQLVPRQGTARLADTGLCYRHSGYQDRTALDRKTQRNKRILLRELEKAPGDEYYLFQLGKTEFCLENFKEAAKAFEAALVQIDFQPGQPPRGHNGIVVAERVLADVLCSLAYSLVNTGRVERARELLEAHAALGHGALRWADFHHVSGYVYLMLGDVPRSQEAYETSLQLGARAELVKGTGSHASFYHLGLLAEARQDLSAAMDHYIQSLRLRPDYSVTLSRCVDFAVEYRTAWPAALWEACAHEAFTRLCADKLCTYLQTGNGEAAQILLAAAKELSPEVLAACANALQQLQ